MFSNMFQKSKPAAGNPPPLPEAAAHIAAAKRHLTESGLIPANLIDTALAQCVKEASIFGGGNVDPADLTACVNHVLAVARNEYPGVGDSLAKALEDHSIFRW